MIPFAYEQTEGGGRVLVLEVDAILSSSTSSETQTTDFPVEDGTDVTDHVITRPDALEVECIVTDRPIDGDYTPGRARAAWETVQRLSKTGVLLTVVTPELGELEDVLLLRLSTKFDAGTVGLLRFTAALRQVRFARSDQVPAPARKEPKTKTDKDNGTKATGITNAQLAERGRSLLKEYLLDGTIDPGRAGGFDFLKPVAFRSPQ